MLEWQEEREFILEIPVSFTRDQSRNDRSKGTFKVRMKEVNMDDSTEIAKRGERTIMDEALLEVYPETLSFKTKDGENLPPELLRTAVLNSPKLLTSMADEYYREVRAKKE